jgi:hypothetical protein
MSRRDFGHCYQYQRVYHRDVNPTLPVETGRRQGDRVEIVSGIEKADKVVTAGGAFLADGSVVRVSDGTTIAKKEEAK